MPSIVQVIFFRNSVALNLKDLVGNVPNAAVEADIEACLRFFDVTGSVTALVEEYGMLNKKKRTSIEAFKPASPLEERMERALWVHAAATEAQRTRETVREQVLAALQNVLKGTMQVVVQCPVHGDFRDVQPHERPELLRIASCARERLFFVFPSTDLYVERHPMGCIV